MTVYSMPGCQETTTSVLRSCPGVQHEWWTTASTAVAMPARGSEVNADGGAPASPGPKKTRRWVSGNRTVVHVRLRFRRSDSGSFVFWAGRRRSESHSHLAIARPHTARSCMATSSCHAAVVDIDSGESSQSGGKLAVPVPVPYVLTFTDLSYVPRDRGWLRCRRPSPAANKTPLLDGVSGEARVGEVLAVMGASGSGKTTLVDALAGRIAPGSLRGRVALNGEPLEGRRRRRAAVSAHVAQDDALHTALTVRETLRFAAELRLPRALPPERRRARVDALVDQLGLARAADAVVGSVSGGERRRVSIGAGIVHDPVLLFLDEPTSGLDSAGAFMVVEVLRRVAQSGSVVVMAIHQPSARILAVVDRLLLLSRGRAVYAGAPAGLRTFFSELGERIPDGENPAEFALDAVRDMELLPDGAAALADFNAKRQLVHAGDEDDNPIGALPPLDSAVAESVSRGKLVAGATTVSGAAVPAFANPPWMEVWVLMRRSFTTMARTPELFAMRLGTVMATAFVLATMFRRLDDTPTGVEERRGFFAMAISAMFFICSDTLPVFVQERRVYLLETAHGAYRRGSYVVAAGAAALPPLVILSVAFAAVTFPAVGLAGGGASFLFFALAVLASFWAGSGFVTFVSGAVPDVVMGYTVVGAALAYFLLFSGFFVARDRIPAYWTWFHYLSLVKYPYQAALQNELGAAAARCFSRGVEVFDGVPVLAGLPEDAKLRVLDAIGAAVGSDMTASTCFATGGDVLAQQAVTDMGKWQCLLVTVAWGFFFRALFYITLLVGNKNTRK
ncbi:hypothetical protein ACP4OV_006741 [Aristida adscensionis]